MVGKRGYKRSEGEPSEGAQKVAECVYLKWGASGREANKMREENDNERWFAAKEVSIGSRTTPEGQAGRLAGWCI